MTSEKKIDYSEHLNNRRQHKRLALFNRFPHPSEIRVDTGALLLFGGFTLLFLLSVFVAQRLPATSLHIMYTTFNGKPIPSLIIWYSLVAIPFALSLLASAVLQCHKGMAMLFYFIKSDVRPLSSRMGSRHSWHQYSFKLFLDSDRDACHRNRPRNLCIRLGYVYQLACCQKTFS